MRATVRDRALQVVQCRDELRLRGPDPSWSLTLDCPGFEIDELLLR